LLNNETNRKNVTVKLCSNISSPQEINVSKKEFAVGNKASHLHCNLKTVNTQVKSLLKKGVYEIKLKLLLFCYKVNNILTTRLNGIKLSVHYLSKIIYRLPHWENPSFRASIKG